MKISAALSALLVAVVSYVPVHADNIKIIAADLPPMFMADGTGREAEIISEVLGRCGHTASFEIQPFTRHWSSFSEGEGDAVATVPIGMGLPGKETAPYIFYQNGSSNLASNDGGYSQLSDLAGKSVIAFKGASSILPGLEGATGSFSRYKEITDQITQSRMIFSGRTDVVIGDGMLFAEYNRQLRDAKDGLDFDPTQAVVFTALFDPSSYAMNFRNPQHAADFDRCFKEANGDGTIAKINTKWVDQYRDTLASSYLGY